MQMCMYVCHCHYLYTQRLYNSFELSCSWHFQKLRRSGFGTKLSGNNWNITHLWSSFRHVPPIKENGGLSPQDS